MRLRLASWSIILLAAACTNDAGTNDGGTLYPETSAIDGLASVIQLSSGETSVVLADYFADPAQVDSFHLGGGLSFSRPEAGELRISGTPDQAMTVLTAFAGSHQYALPVRASRKITHRFSFDPQGNTYEQVQLVGDLNDWNAARGPMTLQDSVWTMETALNPGKYGYKISLDGRYISDPANPDSASNGMGGFNSIVNLEGPDKTKLPRLRTMRHSESNVLLRVIGQADEVIVLWDNHRLSDAQVQFLGDNVSVTLPFAARKRDRSFLRAWAVNQYGVSNDILIPLERGNVVTAPTQLTREDKEASILYFLLVDRFHNGNTGNDAPVEDERVAPRANYFGGDLAGVREKLDNGFFKELGMNTIWLSPILQNPEGAFQEYPEPRRWFSGYHGYWPISFSNIDHRFGTSEELQALVDAAHEQGINVILDVVSNHVHEQHPFIQAHPDWSTDLDLPDGT
ncbi:MAG: alpha-amylase family glycosyl hydrolase, partial [Bacteroidota bacterium]